MRPVHRPSWPGTVGPGLLGRAGFHGGDDQSLLGIVWTDDGLDAELQGPGGGVVDLFGHRGTEGDALIRPPLIDVNVAPAELLDRLGQAPAVGVPADLVATPLPRCWRTRPS